MAKLSVNINKVATIRNARGGDIPNLLRFAQDCELFGADGITVHPRPDQRHVRYKDVIEISSKIKTEFNIEGNPTKEFLSLVKSVKPAQVTLVPDAPNALTSSAGWDTIVNEKFLYSIIKELKSLGIRTSIFVNTDLDIIKKAADIGTDRIELYTGPYAEDFKKNKEKAISPFIAAATLANELGLDVNAGHDLNLENLNYIYKNIPFIKEFSIGHSLISDALYLGIENSIKSYKECLKLKY